MEEKRTNDTAAAPRPPDAPMRRANETPRTDQPMARSRESTWIDQSSISDFERRWHAVQAEFIEDPRRAVGEAGGLMADVMDHIGKNLRSRRGEMEHKSSENDTEAMRLEMRRYKSLMHQMFHGEGSQQPQPMRTEPIPPAQPPKARTSD